MHESPIAQMFVLEGEQIRSRKYILQVLRRRFGENVVKEFEAPINRMEDLNRLQEVFDLALSSRRVSQFRRAMAQG